MSDEITDYGFEWGPMTVTRMTEYRGTRVIGIRSDGNELQVSVSPKGRSIRVWRNGAEMVDGGEQA